MTDERKLPNRRSMRMPWYDYTHGGAYFVMICTHGRKCIFGEIRDGVMQLSRRGMVVRSCWQDTPNHRPDVDLDAFVIMPNHIHGVLFIDPSGGRRSVGATLVSPAVTTGRPHGPSAHSLGAVVGSFKAAVSSGINQLRRGAGTELWQRNYYEHVIRSDQSLNSIRDYVMTNALRWEDDEENPQGDGADVVDAFVQSLIAADSQTAGDTSVAPTGVGQ